MGPKRQKVSKRQEDEDPLFLMEEGKKILNIEMMTREELNACSKYKSRPMSKKLDKFDAMFYNALLPVALKPPRFICVKTLEKLGLHDDVKAVLEDIGLGNLPYDSYSLYPESVRQFLATVRVTYEFPKKPVASQGTLSFIIRHKFYKMTIQDLCKVFGFQSSNEQTEFPKEFPGASAFWNEIGSGEYDTKGQRQSMVRNPVIRCVAKCISNSFFGKKTSTHITIDELWLLYQGTRHLLENANGGVEPSRHDVNLGAVFAGLLVSQKMLALSSAKGVLNIGSLITPILNHHKIEPIIDPKYENVRLLHNVKYFVSCDIIKKEKLYCFVAPDGVTKFCQLPNKEITSLTSHDNLSFLLSPEFLVPGPPLAASKFNREDGHSHISEEHADRQDHRPRRHTQLLPSDFSRYRLQTLPENSTHEERMIWCVDGIQKNNEMLVLILGVLSRNTSDGGAST